MDMDPLDSFYGRSFVEFEAEFVYQATKVQREKERWKNGHALLFFRVGLVDFPVLVELKSLTGMVGLIFNICTTVY